MYIYDIIPLYLSTLQPMSKEELDMADYTLLRVEEIKKEPLDEIFLSCLICGNEECVDVYSERNTSPYYCSACPMEGLMKYDSDSTPETTNIMIRWAFQMTLTVQRNEFNMEILHS